MKRLPAWLLLAGLAVLALVAVGRSSASSTEQRVRAEMRDSVAFAVAVAIAPLRKVAAESEARRLAAEAQLARRRAASVVTLAVTGRTVDSVRANLPESPDSSTVVVLAAYDAMAAQFRAYLASDSVADAAADVARVDQLSVLSKTTDALAAMTQARDAWRQAATCRTVFRIPCPTRTQAAIGGILLGVATVVLLR